MTSRQRAVNGESLSGSPWFSVDLRGSPWIGADMGKVEEFEIRLDGNREVYGPGEAVSGSVRLSAEQPLQCKAIRVNCNGFCGVSSKANDSAWTVEEQYFNSSVSVADKGTLKKGEHTFPFKFLIPASAPTSFEGTYGRIVYRVRAFIDTPRFAKDYNIEKPFYLLSPLNLNLLPDIWGPCSSAVTQQFSYMLMKTGTVVLKAQTDLRGYTAAQVIQVTAQVHNQSGKNTGNIAASLMQRVTYETKRATHDVRAVAEVEGGAVKAGQEKEWKERIIVPALPQSSTAGCDLIKIEYFVKVSLKSPDVMLTLPIHIGNVPLDKKLHPSKRAPPPSSTPAEETPTPEPTLPPRAAHRPAPSPAPRSRVSSSSRPSAPPAQYQPGAEAGTAVALPSKNQSPMVSPSAFSYAPGLFFSHNQQTSLRSPEAGGTTTLYPSLSTGPSPSLLSLPPDYVSSAHPQEAPPSYDESFNT